MTTYNFEHLTETAQNAVRLGSPYRVTFAGGMIVWFEDLKTARQFGAANGLEIEDHQYYGYYKEKSK